MYTLTRETIGAAARGTMTTAGIQLQFTPLLLLYVLSAAVTLGLTVYGARRHYTGDAATETTLAFVGIVLSVSVWTVARSLELLFVGRALSRFWLSVVYVGFGGATMSALLFGLAFTGHRDRLTRRNVAALLVVPVLAVGVAASNQVHELFWASEGFETTSGWWGEIVVHRRTFEPPFYAYLLYTVAAAVTGLAALLRAAFGSATVYRRQRLTLVTGSGAALTAGLLFAADRQPFVPDWLDLSPVGFALMGLCFGYAVFRHRLLDLVPVARDTVVGGMRDGYVVLDTEDRVVDLNGAARELFDVTEAVLGTPVPRAFPDCADVVGDHEHGTRTETDIELDGEGDRRCLNATVSSLYEGDRLVGRLLLLQDVTERRRVQRRYQALIENASDVILVVDCDREITYASPFVEGIVVNAREITGRKQRECELERANERLEEFASVISHDLRNPLNVARGHLELAQETPARAQTEGSQHLDTVDSALDRMEAIIDDVLTLAREGRSIGETGLVELATSARAAWGPSRPAARRWSLPTTSQSRPTATACSSCSRTSFETPSNTPSPARRSHSLLPRRTRGTTPRP